MRPGRALNIVFKTLIVPLPWPIKRCLLQRFFGFELSSSARIGLAWVYPRRLRMGSGARIASFTVAINLDAIEMGTSSSIGRSNWITGFPTGIQSPHFAHQPERHAELLLGDHAAITKHHHIDCTNRITIGAFTTIAGYSSQLLSHAIDLQHNRQHSEPIVIGSYCFLGTNCVILGGSKLPDHSVLGALSLLNKAHLEPWGLYAGQPAQWRKQIDLDAVYFSRKRGYVV
jgi:acetyltransferase-like isoleucine patch superfamily enzyme